MKRLLVAIALSGAVAVPALAAGDSKDPSCADYMAMDKADQMKAVQQMDSSIRELDAAAASVESTTGEGGNTLSAEDLAVGEGTSTGTMGEDMLMANAAKACEAHADGTVGEAMKMMSGS